jgi:hypothetical protein
LGCGVGVVGICFFDDAGRWRCRRWSHIIRDGFMMLEVCEVAEDCQHCHV